MKTNKTNLQIGVVGVGTMGQHHVRILSQTPDVSLAGIYDPDFSRAEAIGGRYGCRSFRSLMELLERTDAVAIAAPTSLHWDIGETCLKRGIHTLMEKPLAHSLAYAEKLVDLASDVGVVLMVGHVERYNPAIGKMMEILHSKPEEIVSIDARRLSPFDGTRCLDVDVLHDLLIHDIDLALEIANSSIIEVSATGRPVFSQRLDMAHTRIQFANQTVAVFWTAKCSPRKVRIITVTTPSRYFEADTLSRSLTVYTAEDLPAMDSGVCVMGNIIREEIPVGDEEPLRLEIKDFVRAVLEGSPPTVDGERGLQALRVLELVARSIESNPSQHFI